MGDRYFFRTAAKTNKFAFEGDDVQNKFFSAASQDLAENIFLL